MKSLRRGAALCIERAREKGDDRSDSALTLALSISSQGTVTRVDVQPHRAHKHDTWLANCLTGLAQRLPFPPGESAYELSIPIRSGPHETSATAATQARASATQASPANDDSDALAQQGLDAYVKGQYELSLKLTEQARKQRPDHPLAVRMAGAANCKLHRVEDARRVIAVTPEKFRNFILMVCQSDGADLVNPAREGYLALTANRPSGILIDGRAIGMTTPVYGWVLGVGRHSVTLVFGNQRQELVVDIKPNQTTRAAGHFE
jgi:hypothetical protein